MSTLPTRAGRYYLLIWQRRGKTPKAVTGFRRLETEHSARADSSLGRLCRRLLLFATVLRDGQWTGNEVHVHGRHSKKQPSCVVFRRGHVGVHPDWSLSSRRTS